MTVRAILLPILVQVGLVFALAFVMAFRRSAVVRAGEVRRSEVSMGERAWPARAQAAANAFSNQFELPVLFYLLVVLAIITRKADLVFVVMSWIFVLSRVVHAVAYVTTNHIPYRFQAYMVGAVTLMAMWLMFAARLLLAPLPA